MAYATLPRREEAPSDHRAHLRAVRPADQTLRSLLGHWGARRALVVPPPKEPAMDAYPIALGTNFNWNVVVDETLDRAHLAIAANHLASSLQHRLLTAVTDDNIIPKRYVIKVSIDFLPWPT